MIVRVVYIYDTATGQTKKVNDGEDVRIDALVYVNDDAFDPEAKIGTVIRAKDRIHFNWNLTKDHVGALKVIAAVAGKLAS